MKLSFFQLWQATRSSYWFLPTLMALGALVLGVLAVGLDVAMGSGWLENISWYQQSKPEAARETLATIAGSMITVAGVVFSITIVAIAFAAGQYGPRVLSNFMQDRGNQVTLGTFIGTFVYSLIVMRTIHSGDSEFVPQFAVLLGIALALCSIAVLIFFIHHVPQSIHVNAVVARIGKELLRQFDARPELNDSGSDRQPPNFSGRRDKPQPICSTGTGYIQAIDHKKIVTLARDRDWMIDLSCGAGDFVHQGQRIGILHSAAKRPDPDREQIESSIRLGNERTPLNDPLFLVDELVEVSARALSSGVNDPYTAMTCLDWLGAVVSRIAAKQPSGTYRDDDGTVRLITCGTSFETVVRRAFGRSRAYFARDANAVEHALEVMAVIASSCRTAEQLQCLERELEGLIASAQIHLDPAEWRRIWAAQRQAKARIHDRRLSLTAARR